LYLLDNLLSMAVIISGLASTFVSSPDDEGVGGWINAEAGYVVAGLFVAAFLAVPLVMPMGIMLAASGFSFRQAFSDSSLRGGALVQTVLALWSYIELYRALRTYSPAQLKLRPRFALVFMRWVVVIMVTYFILDILPPSEPVLLILVVAYIAGFNLCRNGAGPVPARDAGRRRQSGTPRILNHAAVEGSRLAHQKWAQQALTDPALQELFLSRWAA
jgi:hypothetical protein